MTLFFFCSTSSKLQNISKVFSTNLLHTLYLQTSFALFIKHNYVFVVTTDGTLELNKMFVFNFRMVNCWHSWCNIWRKMSAELVWKEDKMWTKKAFFLKLLQTWFCEATFAHLQEQGLGALKMCRHLSDKINSKNAIISLSNVDNVQPSMHKRKTNWTHAVHPDYFEYKTIAMDASTNLLSMSWACPNLNLRGMCWQARLNQSM